MVFKNLFIVAISSAIFFYLFLYPFFYKFLFHLPQEEILVIGIDGGDYETFRSLIEEKKLHNIEKIVSGGTFSTFSTNLKDSYSAWNDLVKCGENSLWNELKKRNISFGTLYWPNVDDKGVFLIPDELEGKKEWPEEMYDSKALLLFKNPVTEFFRKVYWLKIMLPQNKAEKDLVYEFYLLDKKAREFFFLREKFKPKISFLVLSSPLRIQQYFWIYAHPEKFESYVSEKEKDKYGKVIEKYFIEFDDFVGDLNKPNKIIIIVSNRGVEELFPPKIVDKIDVNKILKEVGLLKFDFRGEIDFSKTIAYTLEEGLDQELKIFIKEKDFPTIKEKLKRIFDDSRLLPSNQKIFMVEEFETGIILKRNVSLVLKDDRISFSNKTYDLRDFVLRRIIGIAPERKGFIIVNKKVELPEEMKAGDFCKILLNLTKFQ